MGRSTWHATLYALVLTVTLLSRDVLGYTVMGVPAGVNTDTGERPTRRDLKEFQASGAAFDLYVQALDQFQKDDQSDFLSYYEVSGIHGYPYRAWDGADGPYLTGYCSHGSPIFPTWHRPYVALFEQQIWNYAQTIAATYPDSNRATYVYEAYYLRVPYWDWAADPSLPNCLVTPQITITTPSGPQTIDNPLYTYKFHPLPLGTDIPNNDPLAKYPQTVRSPDPNTGQSRMDNVQSLMQSNAAWLRSNTYQLLSTETNYTVFSNSVLKDRGQDYNNLESIHDAVHALTGDGGHMTYFSMAAFDPIFMIHHCSIDRLIALWQVLNPDSYVQPMADTYGTYVIEAGTVETVDTPLYPFHHSDDPNDYWTSASCRSTQSLGYTYPEIVDWGVDQGTLQNNVRVAINNLYNAPARQITTRKTKRTIRETLKALLTPPDGLQAMAPNTVTGRLSTDDFNRMGVNNLAKLWAINVAVDKHALGGQPFQVHFFYGEPTPETLPSDFGHAPNLIGTYRIFTGPNMPTPPASSRRRSEEDMQDTARISSGQISLSPVLASAMAKGVVDTGLTADTVVPLLSQNLDWRVTDASGNEVDTQRLADDGNLRVSVVSRDVQPIAPGQEHRFPIYGPWTEYAKATAGKIGGLQQ